MKLARAIAVGALFAAAPALAQDVLFDNGDLVTDPGGHATGADLSMAADGQSAGWSWLGEITPSLIFRVADDFEVPAGQTWNISRIRFYGYSTNWPDTGSSPFQTITVRIWDGDPRDPGSQVIAGDLFTDRLIDSQFANMYRTNDPNATARAIFWVDAELETTLSAGTYWVESGTERVAAATSGPWVPGIWWTFQFGGNALHFTSAGEWNQREEDQPFEIYDTADNLLHDNGDQVSAPGGHVTGADLAGNSPGQSLGFNWRNDNTNLQVRRIADDFEVPAGETWTVDKVIAYGYTTGYGNLSVPPVELITLRIWDGHPAAGGQVIFGDKTTNRMISGEWSNIYRTFFGNTGSTDRPVFVYEVDAEGVTLGEGTYWVDTGSGILDGLSTSWYPALSQFHDIGDGLQSSGDGDTWVQLTQEFPFQIIGDSGEPCPPDWNGDGVVDSDDLFDFLADWAAGNADYNGDGVTDSDDLFDFLADWANPGQFPGC